VLASHAHRNTLLLVLDQFVVFTLQIDIPVVFVVVEVVVEGVEIVSLTTNQCYYCILYIVATSPYTS